jgi:hypothetical protein
MLVTAKDMVANVAIYKTSEQLAASLGVANHAKLERA